MAKKLYLHIKWDETIEKNGSKAGDRGIYDVQITEGCEVKLLGHSEKAIVRRLTDDEVTLFVPNKGEYVFKLNETARISYTSGYQVAGDWVDESLIFEVKLSDMSLSEYERSLPDFEIKDGVLIKSRAKGNIITVPEGVVEIGRNAFCRSNHEEIRLPSTIKIISSGAFEGCKYLSKVNLPEGLEQIGSLAFSRTAIETLNFPDSLSFIDEDAFSLSPLLKKIENEKYVIIADRFLYQYNGYDALAAIPDGVTTICPNAFGYRDCGNGYYFYTPEIIVLPDSLKKIGSHAFCRLYGLTEINLREDMEIAENAFELSSYEPQFKEFLAAMNKNEFKDLLEKAENSDANAMYQVGLAYEAGNGIEQNMVEAVAWMKSADELGNMDAHAWLEDYYFDDDACVQAHS